MKYSSKGNMDSAYKMGWEAYKHGVCLSQCPFQPDTDEESEWILGWGDHEFDGDNSNYQRSGSYEF